MRKVSVLSRRTLCILASAIVASGIVLTIATCAAAGEKESKSPKDSYYPGKKNVYAELSKAPNKAVSKRNPMENDPDAIPAGAKLFDEHCAECHGDLAEGTRKGPSLRVTEVQQATPGTLFWVLTNGVVRRGMPVWSKLPEPQRWQIVTYLKSLHAFEPSAQ
jgi:mono/diheme cytochrome c family protein